MSTAFEDVLEANLLYAHEFSIGGLKPQAAKGLGVLTCIDSRIEPLTMLGLKPGDAKILRNAGARATDDALRSLALATSFLSVRRIMVIAHTECAMGGTTDDELRAQLVERGDEVDLSGIELHAAPDPMAALLHDVERIRSSALLPSHVVVGGFVYDVHTGVVREVVPAI